ncbi:TVP38/TMEM64 family protein [Virgibacillus kimchii]
MEYVGDYLVAVIGTGGLLAPLLFIIFHLVRPLVFVPVVFICISGGILFGPVAGTFYSLIGITLSSIIFYFIIRWMPKSYEKFMYLKQKIIGKNTAFTTSQIAVLRLIPFIHFHLLSICLIEVTSGFKDYTRMSLLSNAPLAFVYTSVGGWISNLTPFYIFLFLLILLPIIFMLRRKEMYIKWNDFFQLST